MNTFSKAKKLLTSTQHLTFIYIRIKDALLLKKLYGPQFINQVYHTIKTFLNNKIKNANIALDYVTIGKYEFIIFGQIISAIQNPNWELEKILPLKIELEQTLSEKFFSQIGQELKLEVACAYLLKNQYKDVEKAFLITLKQLRSQAKETIDGKHLQLTNQFYSILKEKQINILYQPIVNLITGKILGWEALARGPKHSYFYSPINLFGFAEEIEELFALEQVCREKAIACIGEIQPNQKLFLNIHPKTLADPNFSPGKTREILASSNLKPENIVFEITEKHSTKDFPLFYKTLNHYRTQNFQIAIDDAGSGYSGLWIIVELGPEYIKIDKDLIHDIDRNPIKRSLIETMVTFANKVGAKIIAEGIETRSELNTLIDIGVHYGQGYYLARPQYPKPELQINLRPFNGNKINVKNKKIGLSFTTIGDLAEQAVSVPPETKVETVYDMLVQDPTISSIIVCNNAQEPIGLIVSSNLTKKLASRFGVALYYTKSVSFVMETDFICVEENTPIEIVAQKVTSRDKDIAYYDIVVTKHNKLVGIVSVQNLLSHINKIQVEVAKGSNPLTGLPGNCCIEQEIERRLNNKQSFSLIYADLDNFKVYNDTYGFKKGDEIIVLLANIMNWAIKRHGNIDDFLGHIGGDDFVLITTPDRVERIGLAITRCFKRLVRKCYSQIDQERGWIEAKGRDGKIGKFALVSVSLAALDCFNKNNTTLQQIAERAAEVKKVAKKIPGNSFFRDRRSPL
ncbi:MAG: bifunctional diguanylate cyclase/phosphodiesterase [Desulfonauticus sp.]|nr:bifunctional diguanylate cyclase/phosphodiesterase [Desulfonauticus sp.]